MVRIAKFVPHWAGAMLISNRLARCALLEKRAGKR